MVAIHGNTEKGMNLKYFEVEKMGLTDSCVCKVKEIDGSKRA